MPLQSGSWTASVGGTPTTFAVTSVDASGNVVGTLGGISGQGFWEENSQILHFICNPAEANSQSAQRFVAYLFQDPMNITGVVGSIVFTLAGYVETFCEGRGIGPAPIAKRSVFGWYAQIGVD